MCKSWLKDNNKMCNKIYKIQSRKSIFRLPIKTEIKRNLEMLESSDCRVLQEWLSPNMNIHVKH